MARSDALSRRDVLAASAGGLVALADVSRALAAPPKSTQQQDHYQQLVLAAGPVAYWRLGEAGLAAAADETGHKHDGVYHGKPKFAAPPALKGSRNPAVVFDGASYLEIPDDAGFSQPTSGRGLSVELWLRPDRLDFPGDGSYPYVHWLGKSDAGRHEWGFRFYNAADTERPNRISAYLWNPDGGLGAGAYFQDPLQAGQWIYIVACFPPGDANTQPTPGVQIYKDGVMRNGPPATGTLYANPKWRIQPQHGTAPVRLGTRDRQGFLIGGLDEVAVYPRVLSPDEIQLHYTVALGQRLSPKELTRIKKFYESNR